MDDGPFRSSETNGTCPRCTGDLDVDGGDRLVCIAGCGAWHPRSTFAVVAWDRISHATPDDMVGWPWGPVPCPTCQHTMGVGVVDGLRFDRCPNHGVWLDRGEFESFALAFGRPGSSSA
jgi:Zn-finger nucleic acid-binding protein